MSIIRDILETHKYEPLDSMTKQSIESMIRESCSGEYEILLTGDNENVLIEFRFGNPEDAVVFKLRYL